MSLRDFIIIIKPSTTDTIPDNKMITLFVLDITLELSLYPFTSFRINALKQNILIKISTVPKPAK